MAKKLHKSRTDKKLGGVCGGIAHTFGVSPTLVRVLTVILLIATGFFPVGLAYLLLMVFLPKSPAGQY